MFEKPELKKEKFPATSEITIYVVKKEGKEFFVWDGVLHPLPGDIEEEKLRRAEVIIEQRMFAETLKKLATNFYIETRRRPNPKLENRDDSYSMNFNPSKEMVEKVKKENEASLVRPLTEEEKDILLKFLIEEEREEKY